ncbi:F-box/LRR-repeat protein At3g26922-like isoform X2 [Salvia miltiorrhiza]|uniref:F-box/LRR-repeat protein At3g26922-like isoform X2 n=1 Tax=Salvia miltiorrhiza TaxID=226208 RepID=UPI0025AB5DA5|nr:F-box/LRR-repeat protein At3g26922-like isoform X2 [Salvia miltiorrhiza]
MASSHFPRIPDSYDRLSELPDSLILSILSLLPSTRDVVRTTILSKRWKDLWTTVPCLVFRNENPEFICGVVAQWRGAKLLRFHLRCWDSLSTSSDVESWLLFAVEKQVEELTLYTNYIPYYRPQSLYSCSSITTLHLQYCSLEIEGSVQLNQLETLSILAPFPSWADGINKILLGAPRLENMSLSSVEIDGNFNITSRSLETLIIRYAKIKGVITISAPNLLTLRIHVYTYNGASFLCNVPSLTEACFEKYYGADDRHFDPFYQLLRSVCHVKKVTLTLLNIKLLLSLKKKKDMVVLFPNAEVLKHTSLSNHVGLLDVLDLLELFPKLKMLSFHRLQQGLKDFNTINAETAFPISSLIHLKRVDMTWDADDPSIIPFIEILLENAPSLDEMVFRLRKCRDARKVLLMVEEKVRGMPRSSPTAKVIILEKLSINQTRL